MFDSDLIDKLFLDLRDYVIDNETHMSLRHPLIYREIVNLITIPRINQDYVEAKNKLELLIELNYASYIRLHMYYSRLYALTNLVTKRPSSINPEFYTRASNIINSEIKQQISLDEEWNLLEQEIISQPTYKTKRPIMIHRTPGIISYEPIRRRN